MQKVKIIKITWIKKDKVGELICPDCKGSYKVIVIKR